MPRYVLRCPFCGAFPSVTPYPDNTGASVQCNTIDCALWHTQIDLEDWNRRKTENTKVKHMLFNVESYYKSGQFFKTQDFVCRGCGKRAARADKVRHTKECPVKEYMDAASRLLLART